MKKIVPLFLALCVLTSLNVFGQESIRYNYTMRKVGKKKISVLKSGTDSLVAQPQEKVKPGVVKRSFTLGDESYYWLWEGSSKATLYKGDSVLAVATKTLSVKGKPYKIKQPNLKRYTYLTQDKEVIKGTISKNQGVRSVDITFLDGQLPDKEALRVASTFYGLTMIEAKQAQSGRILGYTLGFAVGFALGSAVAN